MLIVSFYATFSAPGNYTILADAADVDGLTEPWTYQTWGIGEFPFLIVQLSSNGNANKEDSTGECFAWLREAQQKVVDHTPNTGLVMSYDVGEYADSHPRDKATLARRLVDTYLALESGKEKQLGPRFRQSSIQGTHIRLTFETAGRKLVAAEVIMNRKKGLPARTDPEAFRAEAGKLTGFEICGPDRHFVPAIAFIDGQDVVVESPEVQDPKAVRYAWKNFTVANLFDDRGYPAAGFRTDDYPVPISLGALGI